MIRALAVTSIVGALAAVVVALAAAAQTGARAQPLPGLPAFTAGYESWFRINAKQLPPRASDAHSGFKHIFVNKASFARKLRGKSRYTWPNGTIVVKEVRRAPKGDIIVVAAMRKRAGKWQYVEYSRDSAEQKFSLLAQGSLCSDCHVQAKARDYVFTRVTSR